MSFNLDVLEQHFHKTALGLLDDATKTALQRLVDKQEWNAIKYLNGEEPMVDPSTYMRSIAEAFCFNLSDVAAINHLYRVQHLLIAFRYGDSPAV